MTRKWTAHRQTPRRPDRRAGDHVFRNGDRLRIAGTIVETQGDPAPCFYTLGVKSDTITAP